MTVPMVRIPLPRWSIKPTESFLAVKGRNVPEGKAALGDALLEWVEAAAKRASGIIKKREQKEEEERQKRDEEYKKNGYGAGMEGMPGGMGGMGGGMDDYMD